MPKTFSLLVAFLFGLEYLKYCRWVNASFFIAIYVREILLNVIDNLQNSATYLQRCRYAELFFSTTIDVQILDRFDFLASQMKTVQCALFLLLLSIAWKMCLLLFFFLFSMILVLSFHRALSEIMLILPLYSSKERQD